MQHWLNLAGDSYLGGWFYLYLNPSDRRVERLLDDKSFGGKADSDFYYYVYEGKHGGSSCDDQMACPEVGAYSSEMATSVPELGISLVLPAVPLIAIIVILARQYAKSRKSR